MQCRRCRNVVRFCPCCGVALTSTSDRTSSDTKRLMHSHGAAKLQRTIHSVADGSAAAAVAAPAGNDEENGAEMMNWMLSLPARSVSAYEVYFAEQVNTLEKTSKRARDGDQDDAVQYPSHYHHHHQQQQEQQRRIAVAWLQLPSAVKQRYDDMAQQHAESLRRKQTEHATPTVITASAEADKENREAERLPCLDDESSSGPASVQLPTSSLQRTARHDGSPSAVKSSAPALKKAPRRSGRIVTSFNVFRAENRGQRWSMTEAAAVWQGMSAAEKERYDVAAARCRTENAMAST